MPPAVPLAPLFGVIGVISPAISLHQLLTAWQSDPLSLVAYLLEIGAALAYLEGVRRLKVRGRRWRPERTAAFLGGLVAIVIATGSGLASYDDSVFMLHTVQHLILMNLAPILLGLGAPITLVLQASPRSGQRRVIKLMNNRYVSLVTFPPVAAGLGYLTMIIYFLTPVYDLSIRHPLFHDYTHLHFLVAGCLYWWTVIGVDHSRWHLSYPARLAYLATGIPVNAILGIALTTSRGSIDPAAHSVADTHAGGAVLWAAGELILVAGLAIMFFQWSIQDQREAARADRRLDRELAEQGAGLAGGTTGRASVNGAGLLTKPTRGPGGPPGGPPRRPREGPPDTETPGSRAG
ncbi:MAG: cytochrome c oxidase assembly protein [Acidimicrobiales bacterium]